MTTIEWSADVPFASGRGWMRVCALDDILPDTGVCALVDGQQVAIFRVQVPEGDLLAEDDSARAVNERFFAIGNVDPYSGASVLSRGLIASLGARIVVASPLYKQHFDLQTGECVEEPGIAVPIYPLHVVDAQVWIAHPLAATH